jgi:hypothetical protein
MAGMTPTAASFYQDVLERIGEGMRQLLLLTACVILVGCSRSDMGIVTGSVTVDGEPAKVGAISFFAVDGRAPTAGAPIVDGKFTAHVNPGVCMVQIRVSKVVGRKKIYDTPDSPMREVWAEVLPAKYNDNTQLKLDVKRGENLQEYALATK